MEAAAKRRRKAEEKAATAARRLTVADTLNNPVVSFEGIANIEGTVEHFRGRGQEEAVENAEEVEDAEEVEEVEERAE